MEDVSYFGTVLVYKGMQMGWFLEPFVLLNILFFTLLRVFKTKPSLYRFITPFFMCLEDRVSVFELCNQRINHLEQRKFAISSINSSLAFGIDQKMILSYSSGSSGKG
jgi:phosphate acetyltransferase